MDNDLSRLESDIEVIWDKAKSLGLDPFPTHFEIVPSAMMYEFGAYGIPGRFSHWTHGRAYHQMKTMYDYGLSKIYELVINTNPCYAFLMEANSPVQNKLVVAHVLAHCDFFKNNAYFGHTPRNMIEAVSIHAERIRKYEFRHGKLEIEKFLDGVLSIQEHIDPNVISRRKTAQEYAQERSLQASKVGEFQDLWDMESKKQPEAPKQRRSLEEPEKDLLLFIADNAPDLEDWQRDILHIVRTEMRYFLPQMETKIMNEGWASYWHARILRELDLTGAEHSEFAALHANVLSPSKRTINPYYVGMKIFEDIERRWNDPSEEEVKHFGRKTGQGLNKIFEVREVDNDVSFIRSYLTKPLVEDLDLFLYKREGNEWVVVEKDWEKIRDMIVQSMTNFGYPYIMVEDGDYKRNRELYLKHYYEGQELDLKYAEKTLHYIYALWGRTVHLETVVGDKKTLFSYDGSKNLRSNGQQVFVP